MTVSPSVSSPSKYFDGFIGETQATIALMVALLSQHVIFPGERGGDGPASLHFLGGVWVRG